jgi:DNA-directed RNA polymerase specialized sigma24 family protein
VNEFRRLNHSELDRLSDEGLIAYIREAHARGVRPALEDGFGVLVFRHERNVKLRVRIKVPPSDVDDVAQEALFSAARAALEGREIANFKGLLNKIVSRRIADYTDRRASRPRTEPLVEEHGDDERIWGDVPSVEAENGAVEAQSAIDQAYAELSRVHQAVVDHYVFGALSAKETTDQINALFEGDPELTTPMTNDNVHQIAKRFRDRVRELLEDAQD